MVCRKVVKDHITHKIGFHFLPSAKLIDVAEEAIRLCNEGGHDDVIPLARFGYPDGTIIAKDMAANYQLWDLIETNEDTV